MPDKFAVHVLGVEIGLADGWDQYGDNGIQFDGFEPNEKFMPFFYGDVEPDVICFDLFEADKSKCVLGFLDETEVNYDLKKFLEFIRENV